jgi:hypothetical protein
VFPTKQRLEASYAVVVELDRGLKVNSELLLFDSLVKIHLELTPILDARIHILMVEAEGLPSIGFDPIERQISLMD